MTRRLRFLTLAVVAGSLGPLRTALDAQSSLTPSTTPAAMPGGTLLLVAYAFAWAVVLVYVFTLSRKSKRIQDELRDVISKLKARSAKR